MSLVSAQTRQLATAGWLRSTRYDLVFIAGAASLALTAGALVTAQPQLFPFILFLDLWLLGYHHVIATFTRLQVGDGFQQRTRFLVGYLPPLVLAAVVVLAVSVGTWVIATIYLYWQWFHYTRQSYGIARQYLRKSSQPAPPRLSVDNVVLYGVPLWGILARSNQSPATFLGLDIHPFPVPDAMVTAAGLSALLAVAIWLRNQVVLASHGRLSIGYSSYMLSHIAVFLVGYIVIDSINFGWLVLNIWHNAQYLLLVWLFNTNRFRNGVVTNHRLLSYLSQRSHAVRYFLLYLAITTGIYFSLIRLFDAMAFLSLPLTIIVFQAVNFHHYIVDGIIWRTPRPHQPSWAS